MKKWSRVQNDTPLILVIGGPNGAGKTTTAPVLLPQALAIDQFVNADMIAQGISPFAPQSMGLEAGYLMLKRIHELADRGESFAFETTMASRSYRPFLAAQKQKGYLVHLIYLWLDSVDLALSRVAQRVREGGHDVPPEDVKRRYYRGLRNFFEMYQPLADSWTLCDNSASKLRVVAQGEKGTAPTIFDQKTFDQIKKSCCNAEKDG